MLDTDRPMMWPFGARFPIPDELLVSGAKRSPDRSSSFTDPTKVIPMENPLTPMFELQRTLIELNRDAIDEGIETQQNVLQLFIDGLEEGHSFAETNVELSRTAMHAYVDAAEDVLPEDALDFEDIRETVDEGYDAFGERHDEAWAKLQDALEESGQSYEEFTEEVLERFDATLDRVEEQQERLEEAVEFLDEEAESTDDDIESAAEASSDEVEAAAE